MSLATEIRGENRHSDRYIPAGVYQQIPFGDAYQRQHEFTALWPRIVKPMSHFQVGNILEIGPGSGGETKALQSFYPESQITTVDIDERAEMAAEQNGVEVVSLDLAAAQTPKRIEKLVANRGINTIVALRTSSAIVDNLLKWWDKSLCNKILVFSLMWVSESYELLEQINQQAQKRGAQQIHLANHGRLYDETVTALIH